MGLYDEAQRRGLIDQIPTSGYPKAPAADGSQDNPLNTDVGRNLTNTLGALPGAAPIPGIAARAGGMAARVAGTASALAPAAKLAAPYAPVVAGGSFLAGATNGTTAPPAAAPPSTPDMAGTDEPSRRAVTQQAFGGMPQPPSAPTPPVPGITPSSPPTSAPAPQPQGLAAAAGLVPGRADYSVNTPEIRNSTNDWAARNNLQNAATGASSIMNTRRWGGKGAESSPDVAAYQSALATDQALQKAQPNLYQEAMRLDAGLQREGMQQGGANQRSLWQYVLDQQKVNQAAEAQGYTNRTNALVEAARRQVAAEPDQTKRRSLVEYMRDVEGRAQPADPYLVVPGGQHVDPTSGKAYSTPSSVFNRQSGQFVQQPQAQGGLPPGMTRQVGTSGGKPVYEDATGKRFIGS